MALLRRSLTCVAVAAALLVLGTACVTFVAAVSATDFTSAEQTATLAFLQGLQAANEYLGSSWTGTDFCTWSGVDCTAGQFTPSLTLSSTSCLLALVLPELDTSIDGAQVIFLGITAAGTSDTDRFPSGTLPESWGSLTKLKRFVLNIGSLTGSVPSSWSGLTNLQYISLEDNQLSGSLPSSWSALTSLEKMYLDRNGFTGSIPAQWGGMTALALAQLMHNDFCGCPPDAWTASTSLSGYYDDPVSASDCATTNACPTTTSTTPSSQCSVPGCSTCADGSTTICAVCGKGQTMGIANATCNISGNGAALPLPAGLVAVVVAAVALLVSVAVML